MKYFTLIFMLSLFIGCSNSTKNKTADNVNPDSLDYTLITLDKLPQLGDILPDSIRQTSNNRMHLINSSNFSPSTTVVYNGFTFTIAWDNGGKVNYISTTDVDFETPEKVKINMTLSEIKDKQEVEMYILPGWGYHLKLESGWQVAFCVDKTCTGREILDTDSVKWIYK